MKEHKTWSFDWLPDFQQIVACQEGQMVSEDMEGDREGRSMSVDTEDTRENRNMSSNAGNTPEGQIMSPDMGGIRERQDTRSAAILPPEALAREERIYWKDYEYITQLLPLVARESWAAADAILDRYEFEDSAIYRESPDKVTMQRIADMVYEVMRFYEERPVTQGNDGSEMANPYYCSGEEQKVSSPLRDMIFTMTAWNISYRRQRYYRRRKVFPR